MQEAYSIYQKKRYIRWFLDTYDLKSPKSAKLLNFIAENEDLLQKVNFVDDVRRLPNALIVSSTDAATVSFLCRLNDVYYEQVDEIMEALNNNPPEELFIRLSFDREFLCFICENLTELKPELSDKIFYHQVVKVLEDEITQALHSKEERKAKLLSDIDEALLAGDREQFFELSGLYRKLFSL